MLFIDEIQLSKINITIESFAEHIENYAGVPVLLIKTDESSVMALRNTFQPVIKSSERPGVVKEILPTNSNNDSGEGTTDNNN